jgi:hypothetical protein
LKNDLHSLLIVALAARVKISCISCAILHKAEKVLQFEAVA